MTARNLLVFGYGNPGRGDDALGPELIACIERENVEGAECLNDMQLQVEHVTDLKGRDLLLFIDADASCDPPFRFSQISAEKDDSYTSHAMTPQALLHAYRKVYGEEHPPAFLLRVKGECFVLGDALSEQAVNNLEVALHFFSTLSADIGAERWQELVAI